MTTSFAERIRSELSDYEVDKDVRARVDDWLKADKDFNTWFLVTTKRALADDELMALLDGYRESQELIEAAWDAWVDTRDAAPLLEGLTQSIHRMKLLQDDA